MQTNLNSEELNWIIEMARQKLGDDHKIIQALKECTKGNWRNKAYLQFVNSDNANKPGAEWQIDESVMVENEMQEDIVIDLLKDGRIGGIEFISRIQQQNI